MEGNRRKVNTKIVKCGLPPEKEAWGWGSRCGQGGGRYQFIENLKALSATMAMQLEGGSGGVLTHRSLDNTRTNMHSGKQLHLFMCGIYV